MHDFYAGDSTPCRPEGIEAEYRTRQPFHGAMVLLDECAKLCGGRALFGHFVTLSVTKIVKFLGKIDDHSK